MQNAAAVKYNQGHPGYHLYLVKKCLHMFMSNSPAHIFYTDSLSQNHLTTAQGEFTL